jgi:hypothetical protein
VVSAIPPLQCLEQDLHRNRSDIDEAKWTRTATGIHSILSFATVVSSVVGMAKLDCSQIVSIVRIIEI